MEISNQSLDHLDDVPQNVMHGNAPKPPVHRLKPVLSLILCSRNDQYMGNSPWRLQTALNYIAQNVHELNREEDVEIIVTDWGSEIPLHTVLQLSPIAARMVSFVIVPPALARAVQQDSPFSEVHALNAAARRVNGQYIGRIDQDTLVGKHFLKMFFEFFEESRQLSVSLNSALLFANRRDIPYRFAHHCPSFWSVDQYIRWFGRSLVVENHMKNYKPQLFYCSYVGIWLLHRDLWYECGGYDERLIYMNEMESDMAARLMGGKHKMVNLGILVDYDFYHLGHYHPNAIYQASAHRQVNTKKWHELDEEWSPTVLHPNSEDWGLIQYHLAVMRYSSNSTLFNKGLHGCTILKWPFFILLLMTTGMQMVWDVLDRSLREKLEAAKRGFTYFVRTWGHRTRLVWKTIRGQPLITWKRLLLELWMDKWNSRMQRKINQRR
jgi:Glycosyl transferase family 2